MTTKRNIRTFLGRFFAVLARLAFAALVFLAIAGGYGYYWLDREILSTLPKDLSDFREYRPITTVRVYDRYGQEIDDFYIDKRIWVPLEELPDHVWQAFLAAEDKRFLKHRGVDPSGIVRALIANMQAGNTVQGGSTLTQQLVKNLIVGKEKSYERKLKEAVLAWRLEKELTKSQILELYINFVALGSGNYGVEAASLDYYGTSARNINPGQAALLAGLVPAPSRYSPRSDPALAKERRQVVLRTMVAEGYIDEEDALLYSDDPVLVEGADVHEEIRSGAAYFTQVRREVRRLFGSELPYRLGMQVHTPYDPFVQKVAEDAVRNALLEHQKRHGARGSLKRLPKESWEEFLLRADGLPHDVNTGQALMPREGRCFDALVPSDRDLTKLQAGPYAFALRKADWNIPVLADATNTGTRPLRYLARPGDVLRVCLEGGGEVSVAERPWSEGAAVVLENATGNVVALVGGWESTLEGFVRATQARRQPGSSFKPYVYATALKNGRSQLDTVIDGPLSFPGANGKIWSPRNYSGGYAGAILMRTALAKSLNTVAVRLIVEQGPQNVVATAQAMGVRTPLREDYTIALGSSELTPMDQALGYSTIARLGVAKDPVYIARLLDVNGQLIAEAGGEVVLDGHVVNVLPGGPGERALPAGVAYELSDMLQNVVRAGTGRRAWVEGLYRAGKTGTTNDFIDAWFVGFTPRYTVAVWVGTDATRTLGDRETGGKTALPAWIQIIDALPHEMGEMLPVPPEAVLVPHEGAWIGIARGKVPRDVLSPVDPKDEPLAAFAGGKAVAAGFRAPPPPPRELPVPAVAAPVIDFEAALPPGR